AAPPARPRPPPAPGRRADGLPRGEAPGPSGDGSASVTDVRRRDDTHLVAGSGRSTRYQMTAVALPPSLGAPPALTAVPGRRERVLVPWRLGALVLTGLLGAAAFPIAFPIGPRHELLASGVLEPLAFICLVPMLLAIRRLSPWRAFGAGMLAGMVFFTGAF